MTPFRLGAILGAIATASYLLTELGLPPPDIFFWGVILILAGCGALLGGGVVLSWQHVRRAPRVLFPTAIGLALLSLLPATCYWSDTRAAAAVLADADSVRGVITGRNIFGELLITFRTDSGASRLVAPEKRAHSQFGVGDSIWVYRQRTAPHRVEVWPPGPDRYITARRLLWLWIIGGVLLVAYGLPATAWIASERSRQSDGVPP
jgi:hypothetical protein